MILAIAILLFTLAARAVISGIIGIFIRHPAGIPLAAVGTTLAIGIVIGCHTFT